MPDKPLYLIRHARNKARHGRISVEEVADAIDHPDGTTKSIKNRVNYWRRWRQGWLRVTIVEEPERIVVITITPRRKGPEDVG